MAEWRSLANCIGVPPEMFFSERASDVAMAKECCRTCPVAQPCREEARMYREYGTWGNETETERASAGYTPSSERGVLLIRA